MTQEATPNTLTLPEMNQAVLTWPELERLLADIEQCTEVQEILPKYSRQGYVPESQQITLANARTLLQRTDVRGLQIRYRYDNADWFDTIMVLNGNYRLVRIRHDFSQIA